MRQLVVPAAGVLALALLVKVAAAIAVVGIAVWMWHRIGRRAAVVFSAICTGVVIIGFELAGGSAVLRALSGATEQWSRASLWNHPRDWLASIATFSGPVVRGVSRGSAEFTGSVATAVIVVVTFAVLMVLRRGLDAPRAAIVGPLVFILLAAYALPRYGIWALPVAGLVWRSALARLLALTIAALQLVYLRPAIDVAGPAVGFFRVLDAILVPVLVSAALVGLVLHLRRRTTRVVPVSS
jgi:hypothetical protein